MTRLTDWIGRTETATETLRPFPADALAATLDRDERYPEGAALPEIGPRASDAVRVSSR